MRDELQKYERIDQYLFGKLSPQERLKFEEQMQANQEFAKLVEIQKITNELIFDAGLLDIKSKLQTIDRKESETIKKNNNLKRNSLFGLAGLILLSTAIYIYNSINLSENITKQAHQNIISQTPQQHTVQTTISPIIEQSSVPSTPIRINIKEKYNNHTIQNNVITTQGNEHPIQTIQISADSTKQTEKQKHEHPNDTLLKSNINTSEIDIIPVSLPVDKCKGVKITAKITFEPSCEEQRTGIIYINEVEGGTPPYQYSIDGGKNYYSKTTFDHLYPKQYNIVIKDAFACVATIDKQFRLASKQCTKDKEYEFAPDFDEFLWQIPIESKLKGEMFVLNREGQVIFKKYVNDGGENVWDGRDIQHKPVPMGRYLFLIKYIDGSLSRGFITIIR